MQNLTASQWRPRARAHAERVDRWVRPHLERRRRGEKHAVHDFLFTYYRQRPAALRRWHPGWGVRLLDAPEYDGLTGYVDGAVSSAHLESRLPLVESLHRLLVATAGRAPSLGCFGLHEWAMVHGTDDVRHDWPLRLGASATDAVVESHRIQCSHFDAFRFFTPSARPLNTLTPGPADRAAFEQPGCLHAGMDLYKHAFRLTPLVRSELVADCFELAWDIRVLDMRASPYDFTGMGLAPVRIETPEGKQEYVAAQRAFAERGAPLRQRLVEECERLAGVLDPRWSPARAGASARTTLGRMEPDATSELVGRFVKDGRLVIMPSKRSKLLPVLDHLAQCFEPGRTYTEPEVNEALSGFHDDYAALRRYLVDEGFMTREGGVYWRSGGTVDV